MEQDRIKKFKEVLRHRYKSPERFKISYDAETIEQLLYECYQNEVTGRRMNFIADDLCRNYISKVSKWLTGNYKTGLLLYGGVGNGKTTLSRAVSKLIDILYRNNDNFWSYDSPLCITALDVAKIALNDDAYFKKIKTADKLIIDDLGTEPSTVKSWGNEISPVTEILYHRYDHQLFTIVTSNLNDKEIKDRYGIRISDRFEEMFDKIYFSGLSYRR